MLKILYRTASVAYDVAGLQAIDLEHERLVNIDLTQLINGKLSRKTRQGYTV